MMLHFFDENGYYVESSEGRLDPAEMLRGREKYLMPKNALLGELPACGENQRIKRVGDIMVAEGIVATSFIITLTKLVEWAAFGNELNNAGVNFEKLAEDKLRACMDETAENIMTVDLVIRAHDYDTATRAKRVNEVKAELADLDRRAIRPILQVVAKKETAADLEKIAEIVGKKELLWLELAEKASKV